MALSSKRPQSSVFPPLINTDTLFNPIHSMSSLPRKTGSNTAGGLAAVAQQRAASAKQQTSLPSSQYLDAINILSEATILEACALALSEKDYEEEQDNSGEKSEFKKLLELEKKCRHAVKVVHKEAIPAPSAMMPPSMPTIPASRVNPGAAAKKSATGKTLGNAPKALLGKNVAPTPGVGKPGVVPIRRGSLAGSRPIVLPGKRVMPQQLKRSESEESSLGGSEPNGNPANKKARLTTSAGGGGGPSSLSSSEGKGDAPPASALDFLKKLNQEKAAPVTATAAETTSTSKPPKSKGESKASSNKEKVSNDGNNSDGEGNTSETSDQDRSPPREGTRKNPSRGVRR